MLELEIKIEPRELWDEKNEEFVYTAGTNGPIKLKHSLVSVSEWEAKWKKPFLGVQRNREETIDYIRCMTITQNVDPKAYESIDAATLKKINDYINDPMTATWFSDRKNTPPTRKKITSELIYYWMISLGIPFECQKWHLNRLLTLIRVCENKNAPPKKMSKKAIANQNALLNQQRRQARGSKG